MAPTSTVPQAFHQLVTKLELTEKEQSEASRQQNVVRDKLREGLAITRDFLSGSYMRRTAIRPLKDIDLVIELDEGAHGGLRSSPPQKTLDLVRDVLVKAYPNVNPLPRVQARSVNIEFKGTEIGYDVVPAFRHKDGGYLIPDTERGGWIRSDPELHRKACVEANQKAGSALNALIKMAKSVNVRHGRPLRSFHLEVMTYGVFSGPPDGFATGLHHLFRSLADRVMISCPDPAGLGPNIDQGMTSADRSRIRTKLQEWERWASEALTAATRGDVNTAHARWSRLFGPVYPAYREG